jgi:hypothetical protein
MIDDANVPPSHNDKERRGSSSRSSVNTKLENAGAPVTRTQQWRILSSTCLVAFTVIGFTQSFGVFQAHYGREEAVLEGVLRRDDLLRRPLVSAIGSFGNGGLVATFGVLYYPHLPKLGGWTNWVCISGTSFIAIGFATAAASHSVRKRNPASLGHILMQHSWPHWSDARVFWLAWGQEFSSTSLRPSFPNIFLREADLRKGSCSHVGLVQ